VYSNLTINNVCNNYFVTRLWQRNVFTCPSLCPLMAAYALSTIHFSTPLTVKLSLSPMSLSIHQGACGMLQVLMDVSTPGSNFSEHLFIPRSCLDILAVAGQTSISILHLQADRCIPTCQIDLNNVWRISNCYKTDIGPEGHLDSISHNRTRMDIDPEHVRTPSTLCLKP
jgi:hypothetical protein